MTRWLTRTIIPCKMVIFLFRFNWFSKQLFQKLQNVLNAECVRVCVFLHSLAVASCSTLLLKPMSWLTHVQNTLDFTLISKWMQFCRPICTNRMVFIYSDDCRRCSQMISSNNELSLHTFSSFPSPFPSLLARLSRKENEAKSALFWLERGYSIYSNRLLRVNSLSFSQNFFQSSGDNVFGTLLCEIFELNYAIYIFIH